MNAPNVTSESIAVNSSAIKSANYFSEKKILQLYFQNHSVYTYRGVPNHVFEGLRSSESKGKFINEYVTRVYSYKRS